MTSLQVISFFVISSFLFVFSLPSLPCVVLFFVIMPVVVPLFEQGRIYEALQREKNVSHVADHFARDPGTVRKIQNARGRPLERAPPRRPSASIVARREKAAKLAEEVKHLPRRDIPGKPSSKAIAQALREEGIRTSARTVRRDLKADGLRHYVRPKRPFYRDDERTVTKRRKFCETVEDTTKGMCRHVLRRRFVFSDEHTSTTNDHSRRGQWARSRSAVLPRERLATRNVPRVMIWAAIGWNFKSKLCFVDRSKDPDTGKCRTQTQRTYIDNCLARSGVITHLKKTGKIFQQDGARCHTGKVATKYLKDKGVHVLPNWPAFSPHLSPIENLWDYVETQRSERYGVAADEEELKSQLLEIWEGIDLPLVNKYVESFEKKVKECAAAGGK